MKINRLCELSESTGRRLGDVEQVLNNRPAGNAVPRRVRFAALPNFPLQSVQDLENFNQQLIDDRDLQDVFVS